jgi:hypothetical protein
MENVDIIDRGDKVIVIGPPPREQKVDIPVQDNVLLWKSNVPEDLFEYAVEHTEYLDCRSEETVDWPVSVTQTHHLEGTLGVKIPHKLESIMGEKAGYEHFHSEMDSSPNYPSIELVENWAVSSDGSVELESVKYDGVLYTPEK